jgi:hypothetical protein
MRRIVATVAGAFALCVIATAAWANHNAPPTRYDLPSSLGHLVVSAESTKGPGAAGVDCAARTTDPNGTECYQNADQLRKGSGGDARFVLLSGITGNNPTPFAKQDAGPLHYFGVYSNEAGTPSGNGRVWTGVRADGVGTVAVAAGGGAADSTGHPHGCVQAFVQDGSGGQISGALASAGLSDNASDTDTDYQICGVIGG